MERITRVALICVLIFISSSNGLSVHLDLLKILAVSVVAETDVKRWPGREAEKISLV